MPVNINSLLRNIVLSGLTILIDESLDVPGQLSILAVLSHGLNQLLLLGMIEVSIGLINITQTGGCKQREQSLPKSKPVVTLEVSDWLFSFSFDFLVKLRSHENLKLIEDVTLEGLGNVWIDVS